MYDGYKTLAASIFNQAISDYKKLLKKQKNKERIQREIKENECFFRSEWANDLAEHLEITYNPEKLIEKLRKEAE